MAINQLRKNAKFKIVEYYKRHKMSDERSAKEIVFELSHHRNSCRKSKDRLTYFMLSLSIPESRGLSSSYNTVSKVKFLACLRLAAIESTGLRWRCSNRAFT